MNATTNNSQEQWLTPPPIPTPQASTAQQATPAAGPLSNDDLAEIRRGARNRRFLDKTARRARLSAAITLIIGISALPFVAFSPTLAGVIAVVGISIVGIVEWIGSKRIARADHRAPTMLGWNQVFFLGVICLYCAIQMLSYSPETLKNEAISPEFRQQLTQMPSMLDSLDQNIDQWGMTIIYGFYGLVIVLSVLMQGGQALYYFRRRRMLQDYHGNTPDWVHQVLQAAHS